jgi:hypothetical protein
MGQAGTPREKLDAALRLCLAVALGSALLARGVRAEPVEVSVRLDSGAEIVSERYPAAGDILAVWLTGQFGRSEEERRAAADMAARGVETWLTDFLAPYFLPLLPSSWNQIPERDMRDWLDALHRQNPGKRIVLIASGRIAAPTLRAARDWHAGDPANPLAGALLMWPLLYQELAPGEAPDYDPIVRQTRMDVVILQPKSSAGFWWRDRLKGFLEAAGSRVWLNVLPGLRDGFYRRGDITPQEISAAGRLGEILVDGIKPLLEKGKP